MGSFEAEKSGLFVGRFSAITLGELVALGEEEARKRELFGNAEGERKRVAAIAENQLRFSVTSRAGSAVGERLQQLILCKREREIFGVGSSTGGSHHVDELGIEPRVRSQTVGIVSAAQAMHVPVSIMKPASISAPYEFWYEDKTGDCLAGSIPESTVRYRERGSKMISRN